MLNTDLSSQHVHHWDMQPDTNYYVFGDIHGCYDQFLAVLKHAGFNFSKDIAISLGDVVDRGTADLQCTTLINEPWFHMIKGNHEQLHEMGFISHPSNGTKWAEYVLALPPEHPDYQTYAQFVSTVQTLPNAIVLDNRYVLIHAALPPICYSNYFDPTADSVIQALHNHSYEPRLSTPEPTLWSIDYFKHYDPITFASVDFIFHGHLILDKLSLKGNTLFMDTGFMAPQFSHLTRNSLSFAILNSNYTPSLFTSTVDFSTNKVVNFSETILPT